MKKIEEFEYFLKRLAEWFCNYYQTDIAGFNDHPENDLSKLKVIKIHFFTSSTTNDMLEIFDNFHAMPYGHVESTIYRSLDDLNHFQIDNSKLRITNQSAFESISSEKSAIIDDAILKIKQNNSDLVAMEAFELVELSHKWFSWRQIFSQARMNGVFSGKIDAELIKKEQKIYSLF